MVCLFECLRTTNEPKSRRLVARLLHLYRALCVVDQELEALDAKAKPESGADEQLLGKSLDELLDLYVPNVPVSVWLFWLDQLVQEVHRSARPGVANILKRVAEVYPQQSLLALRRVLPPAVITLRMEDSESPSTDPHNSV